MGLEMMKGTNLNVLIFSIMQSLIYHFGSSLDGVIGGLGFGCVGEISDIWGELWGFGNERVSV
jgi:hypothetical protein